MKRLFAFLIVGLLIGIMTPATYSYDTGKSPPVTVVTNDVDHHDATVMLTQTDFITINSNLFERGVKLSPGDINIESYEAFISYNDYALDYKLLFAGSDSYNNTRKSDTNLSCKYFKGRCTYY